MRIAQHDLERFSDLLRSRATTNVEKVRGLAAVELDHIHRRHRESGAVDETADVAVERDVREVEFRGLDLGRVFLVQITHRDDVGMTKKCVRVEIELRVERNHLAVAGQNEWIDLGERCVRFVECFVQTLKHRARLRQASFRNTDLARDVVGLGTGQSFDGIDKDLVNLLRRFGGDFFDVHAAFGARHQRDAL